MSDGAALSVYERPEEVSSPQEALTLLKEGNQRYLTGQTLKQDVGVENENTWWKRGKSPLR